MELCWKVLYFGPGDLSDGHFFDGIAKKNDYMNDFYCRFFFTKRRKKRQSSGASFSTIRILTTIKTIFLYIIVLMIAFIVLFCVVVFKVACMGGVQNSEWSNVERPIFWNFKITNIKIAKYELFDYFIYEFSFINFLNCVTTQSIW